MDLVYFIVLVGVLIFVHELGHFAWAKFFGVKVLRFSLGFGPRLVGFRKGETEYVIAAVPLGGYVKMLGESPGDVIRPEEEERAFHTQPLWRRVVIVVAGPAMNLLFPVVLYFVVFLGDAQLPPAVIGTVLPGGAAAGELEPGDRVKAIEDEEVETFYDLNRIVSASPGRELTFEVERDGESLEVEITPTLTEVRRPLDLRDEVGRIGVMHRHPAAVVGVTSPHSPAYAAEMRTFDVVVSAAGQPVDRWLDLERVFDGNRGSLVPLTYLRPTRVEGALGGLVELDVYEPRLAAVTPEPGEGSGISRAGLEPADLYVSHVMVGSGEARAGLLPGDRILALDGKKARYFRDFQERLRAGGGEARELAWRRGNETITRTLRLRTETGVTEHGQPYEERPVLGIDNWVPTVAAVPVENPSPITYAGREAIRSTWEMVELTVFSVVRLLQGRLTVKSIGGPLTVLEATGTAAAEGTLNYLTLMAFISVNLGLINLLPIPLLDGGHLMFFAIEAITRRRISDRVRQYAAIAGLTVLILLMILAFKNDIERQWPRISDHIGSTE